MIKIQFCLALVYWVFIQYMYAWTSKKQEKGI